MDTGDFTWAGLVGGLVASLIGAGVSGAVTLAALRATLRNNRRTAMRERLHDAIAEALTAQGALEASTPRVGSEWERFTDDIRETITAAETSLTKLWLVAEVSEYPNLRDALRVARVALVSASDAYERTRAPEAFQTLKDGAAFIVTLSVLWLNAPEKFARPDKGGKSLQDMIDEYQSALAARREGRPIFDA